MSEALNVIFMGTPDFAVPALNAIQNSDHNVTAVYTQPPRAKGRGHKVQKSPIHAYADTHGIPVFHPTSFKDENARDAFKNINADVAVVAAYGLILPSVVLGAPKHGCINIHASILPRWRGASPIQHAIWKGDKTSGVTIMQMERGLDTGPMIVKGETAITDTVTAQELHDALSKIGGDLIIDVLNNITSIQAEKQNDDASTYAPMLKKEDGKIDWTLNATDINCQIRALNPWPGTFCMNGDKRLKIKGSRLSSATSNAAPGTILDRDGMVTCGTGTLKLTSVQPDGAKAMDVASAINGGYLKIGDVLS